MYLAIITLPLLGSIVSGFFGRKVGVSGAQLITCTSVIATTLLAIVAFFEVGLNNIPVSINLFRWIDSESLNVLWSFHFDSLTVSMLIPVLIVSSLVHIYSIGYMSHDPHNQRFFSYLSLFTFMMIILVTANNFLLMFVGWEGVGICSYLLVSFWFTRIAANQSSMSAFLTNRVGDCFLTIGMFAILWSFGNIDYSTVFSLAPFVNENIVTIIGICLLIGAMAKSSQVGLHVWLPMAMEGPTPVSALIHAATMVTAGVYLLMRTSPLIEYSSTVLILCLWLGAITTVFSSLIGLFQQDIKKVIAYSTMSQLGMMVIAVGLSSYNIALFHLVNHAFYKGLLFLGAGAVIHAVADNQDFRKYGGLRPFLPLTYSVMLIASLSLVAFPFMTGFYSKDFILESAYGQFYFSGTVVYFIAIIGAMFTTLYSVKVLYLTFLTNPNGPVVSYTHAHESDIFMSLPLIILAVFSIFFGYITKDIFIGLGSSFFADNSLFIHPTHEIMLDTEFAIPTLFKLLPLVFTISLSVLTIIFSEFLGQIIITFKFSRLGYNIFGFFNQRFLIELFYNKYITGLVLKLGGQTTKILDKGSVELLGPYGLEKGLITLSKNIVSLDTGVITSYALYILIGLIFYILIPYLSLFDNSLLLLILLSLFSIVNTYTYNNINNTLQSNIFGNFFKNFGRNIRENFSKKKILSSLISILIVALFKIYIGNGFNPLTFSNFRSVLTSPVSIYGAMGLSGLFLSAKLFIASLIDSFHIKLSIFKQLFKLLSKLLKNHMFLKLPVVHNIDNKLEIKKHIIAVYMEQSESSNTKNKEESSTKGNSNTKNKDNSSTKENSNTKTKKGISNRQYNTKNWALPNITDNLSDKEVWEAAVERRTLFKALYEFYKYEVLGLGYDPDLRKEGKINPRTPFYKKAFIPHYQEWESIMKFINSKPLDSDRATEIKITNRIDNAISKLPSKIIPRVNKVGTVFVVDENSFDYTTLKVKKK
jgi:NADH-ubiquinone oxidoreductase chain 5